VEGATDAERVEDVPGTQQGIAVEPTWIREVMDRFERPLLRYALRIVGDEEAARDVVQDTLCKLHAQPRARVEGKLAEWLYTVCRNRALDVRRKEGRMKVAATEVAARPSPEPGPAAVAERKDTTRRMLRLMGGLPPNQQEVLRLKFEHGLSYQEISNVTKLSVGNVGYLLHVAIKTLGQKLETA
jgi:RNA polymerase sigma-70 factor (ECF subfamily)